jgi:hypothetical protein
MRMQEREDTCTDENAHPRACLPFLFFENNLLVRIAFVDNKKT